MQNIDEKLKVRLLKLQALAEQGVDGEAVSAKEILNIQKMAEGMPEAQLQRNLLEGKE